MRAIETGTVTRLYGEPGSDKSLLCYTTCVMLSSQCRAIYIDRPHSIELIAQARGLESSMVLQNIQVASPHRFSTFSRKAQVPSGGDVICYVVLTQSLRLSENRILQKIHDLRLTPRIRYQLF